VIVVKCGGVYVDNLWITPIITQIVYPPKVVTPIKL